VSAELASGYDTVNIWKVLSEHLSPCMESITYFEGRVDQLHLCTKLKKTLLRCYNQCISFYSNKQRSLQNILQ